MARVLTQLWGSQRASARLVKKDACRALYLYRDDRDTMYRLHGTNEPWSIGRRVLSGCVRLFNDDIIYDRTPIGTRVLII